MPRRLSRPGHRRGKRRLRGLDTLAIPFVSVWCAFGATAAFSDLNDCDFSVTGAAGDERNRTNDEVEAELVRQLAIKLRQFDRCLDRETATAASPAEGSSPHAVEGGQTGVASSGYGGQNSGDGAGQVRPDAGGLEQVGDPIAAVGNEAGTHGNGENDGSPAGLATPDAVATAAVADRTEGSGMPGGQERARDTVVEDDVARILRQAAEKETDPARRAALWKEYENYVKNL